MKQNIYFLGIGGIGMSALARYFMHEGRHVAGYDRTPSDLTRRLESEGAEVHYADDPSLVGERFRDPASTLVIYTPAIPPDHREWAWLRENGFEIVKRSQALGHIAGDRFVMAVAGTHGKTTTTTLAAWLDHRAGSRGSAFLGGISKNFDSNLVLGPGERLAVEADEFDRSFLRLHPDVAVVTSADADHLDIYGTHESLLEAFAQFVRQVKRAAIVKLGVELPLDNPTARIYRYSYHTPCDFYAANIRLREGGYYMFDIVCPDRAVRDCTLGVPGHINVENAVAATALMWAAWRYGQAGGPFDEEGLRLALKGFAGVKRRFEFYMNTPKLVYMDDYAHHPRELEAAITSVRDMFPARRLTVVFQPHLYTRTRDFYPDFARALSLADEAILLPVYPAREEPIEGVTTEMIAGLMSIPCRIVPKERLVETLAATELDVAITFGAGDIDNYCEAIADKLRARQ
ncbi:MAG: UDP-N-acetylmuramate--L-alanine ligase [Rikenellaceae bacterium]|jgi:UDP-N-acetylmuramate--alanine ligase|nr:UDP-N-acetylmuramate--L-alanine ligase [Rikenellaceae bacterium]